MNSFIILLSVFVVLVLLFGKLICVIFLIVVEGFKNLKFIVVDELNVIVVILEFEVYSVFNVWLSVFFIFLNLYLLVDLELFKIIMMF